MIPTPATVHPTLRVSEVFLSIQGEGPSAGTPAHFLRLQGCDVGCTWCDSRYTWAPDGGDAVTVDEALDRARALGAADLIVVTGGEPLDHPNVAPLLERALARWRTVEVETSGVKPPPLRDPRLHYNVSPKLPRVTPRWRDTWAHVRAFADDPGATFKLVVGADPDLGEALRLVAEHGLAHERVMLMPEGLTDDAVRARAADLAPACVRNGFRMSPRLHIWMWGPRRGV